MHTDAMDRLATGLASERNALYGFARVRAGNGDVSALALAVPHARRLTLEAYTENAFHGILCEARERMLALRARVEAALRDLGIPYDVPQMSQTSEATLEAPLSFKHVAVRAGLGWMGTNGVLLTPTYGPMVALTAIVLDADVPPGQPLERSACPEGCDACVRACPYGAIKGARWEGNTKRFELIDFHLCNQKRTLYMLQHDRKHACGYCMVACPVGRDAWKDGVLR